MMEVIDFAGDRISELPDPILTNILSFLPTEEAVRTCILSKRWKNVWASLPVLVFDDHTSRNDALTQEEFLQREDKFLEFLRGVMLNRENIMLDTFKLKLCSNRWDTHILVCAFLHIAVMCSPRVLSIHIDMGTIIKLPDHSIFTCTSIEKMSLWLQPNVAFHILKPTSINLPFLKNLELGLVHLTDDLMRMLISGCSVLEELALIGCYLELNMLSSNVLKKLVLKYCAQRGGQMEISCPGVVSLSIIRGIYTGGITLKNMSSLATADILFLEDDMDHPSNLYLRLLRGLSNVTSLKLHTNYRDVMVLLLADIPNCPTLKNLKSLELGELDFNNDWNLVACFLKHSSNLMYLTLHFKQPNGGATEEDLEREIVFQQEYLQAVNISCPGKNATLVKERDHYQEELVVTTAKIIIL